MISLRACCVSSKDVPVIQFKQKMVLFSRKKNVRKPLRGFRSASVCCLTFFVLMLSHQKLLWNYIQKYNYYNYGLCLYFSLILSRVFCESGCRKTTQHDIVFASFSLKSSTRSILPSKLSSTVTFCFNFNWHQSQKPYKH